MIKNIFFDLDGTLLPMDMRRFIKLYLTSLSEAVCPYINVEPKMLERAIFSGMEAMYKNDGSMTNKMRFWNSAASLLGPDILNHTSYFDAYYNNEFIKTRDACDQSKIAIDTVDILRNKGYNMVIATNPIFPKIATERRIKWTGLNKDDFILFTSYETSKFTKPNPKYFSETCELAGVKPEESLMVGNDVDEDMAAAKIGMQTYLITDYAINRNDKDYSEYPHGTYQDFFNYCLSLPTIK
ncbi:MAG: HAD family hydrolase [Ruminococcus sp.]|nr:HAD family hydrolase [Ruminococcus sp.]